MIKFIKMTALGNDFIMIDGREFSSSIFRNRAVELCNRNFGIGADGLIFVEPTEISNRFRMVIINSDGSEAEMCGNGIRCFALYVETVYGFTDFPLEVETLAGVRIIEKISDEYRVDMGAPIFIDRDLPSADRYTVKYNDISIIPVSMGNPHAVILLGDKELLLEEVGPLIENLPIFPKRTNVEFTDIINRDEINLRVWERGCGETLACGTGTCAAVVGAIIKGKLNNSVVAHLKGGDLKISWSGSPNDSVFMQGKAIALFHGEWIK